MQIGGGVPPLGLSLSHPKIRAKDYQLSGRVVLSASGLRNSDTEDNCIGRKPGRLRRPAGCPANSTVLLRRKAMRGRRKNANPAARKRCAILLQPPAPVRIGQIGGLHLRRAAVLHCMKMDGTLTRGVARAAMRFRSNSGGSQRASSRGAKRSTSGSHHQCQQRQRTDGFRNKNFRSF